MLSEHLCNCHLTDNTLHQILKLKSIYVDFLLICIFIFLFYICHTVYTIVAYT